MVLMSSTVIKWQSPTQTSAHHTFHQYKDICYFDHFYWKFQENSFFWYFFANETINSNQLPIRSNQNSRTCSLICLSTVPINRCCRISSEKQQFLRLCGHQSAHNARLKQVFLEKHNVISSFFYVLGTNYHHSAIIAQIKNKFRKTKFEKIFQ